MSMIINMNIRSGWRHRPLLPPPLAGLHLQEMFHVLLRHPGSRVRNMSADDDCPPLLDILGSDTVGHLVGRVSVHTQSSSSLYCHLGLRWTNTNWLETELENKSYWNLIFSLYHCLSLPCIQKRDMSH